ncbi:serine/threonine-protein kinase PknD [Chlamydia sp. 17-3921]|uniref:serine/threonine-protein kinase PknD n=1 Tax=Chlamydia sp. 17-3921 TaxID=2675798 RepID=UPI001919E597|nr:serine/threonine-protein kinase PknD [Chlamydia sp. 17-3921]
MQRYDIIRLIGKGGMGEVYLAYDPVCSRRVALKKIREDLSDNALLKRRFLREAKIAADLVHPGVVSVYTICSDQDPVYYTMPYIEGYTLKSLLKSVWKKESLSKELAERTSVGAFLSIFYKICSTIEYVHARGILHRDLKPDNILLGLFSEVVILDWGAAVSFSCDNHPFVDLHEETITTTSSQMTIHGKIVGTPDYMAPERLLGLPASESTDIYALGVILYQMLTLSFPYRRKRGKKIMVDNQAILSPEEIAPYREIPPFLSFIVMKALAVDPKQRYQSVSELKIDVERHLQGNPKWILKKNLDPKNPQSWKWCEPILLSKYFPMLEVSPASWYSLAISNIESFSQTRLEYSLLRIGLVEGFGILLPPSGKSSEGNFYHGYGFWLHIKENIFSVSLVKNGLEIQKVSQKIDLDKHVFSITLEKHNHSLSLYIENVLWLVHMDYLPGCGGHIGLIVQNMENVCGDIGIFESSGSLHVSCLAVPDAFLAEKLYDRALIFYKRIAESFPGRKEGCEALFRAGISLLEKASEEKDEQGFSKALEEFAHLHQSVAAPLEYLGKALVYQRLGEHYEEVKSLLLALKRYSQHPEISRLKDHIVYRLHESLHKNHRVALVFILLVLQSAPELISLGQEEKLLFWLNNKIQDSLFCRLDISPLDFRSSKMELFLSFWSGFTPLLPGLFQRAWDLKDFRALAEIFFVATDLKYYEFLDLYTETFKNYTRNVELSQESLEFSPEEFIFFLHGLNALVKEQGTSVIFANIDALSPILILYLFDLLAKDALMYSRVDDVLDAIAIIRSYLPVEWYSEYLLPYEIRARLWNYEKKEAYNLLCQYPNSLWLDNCHEAFVLYGCWLALSEGKESAEQHFRKGEREDLLPRSLLARNENLCEEALCFRERQLLLVQKFLYFHCLGLEKEREQSKIAYEHLFNERFL